MMSDETFFREVNEEIRQQRVHDLWKRFGRLILAAAVLAVIAAGAYVAWREYQLSKANAAGDRFTAAVDLADQNKPDEALKQLQAIAADGFGSYPQLATLRIASIHARQGDAKAALEGFDKVANDANAPKSLRDIASIRAGYVLVDTGSLDDVRARVERLSGDAEPLRYAAREALGLAAWKAGKLDDAKRFLQANRDDPRTPQGIALRTNVVLALAEAGTTPETAAAEAATAPAAAPAPAAALPDTPIPLDLSSPPGSPEPTEAAPDAGIPPAAPEAPAPAAPAGAPAAPSN
ncbi:tetratricopeptide repeat protein [Aureimonas leprariae]|uniref:Ancillary SecYEG translocon subunit n=2 Tax=Plantimonas leprariae TaxID=2615207 RepID=A0A7V7PQ92_9HYPH|nr:tetratricopeptide repeat protein [Aureimonas leprariae]